MKLNQIIKEVAENLQIPYKDVDAIVKFAFSSPAKAMKNKEPKVTVRYIGTFTRKLSKKERYKNYLKKNNENN